MADIEKVQVGDTLRIDVKVVATYPGSLARVSAAGGGVVFPISRTALEAAEHVPAPKVFKRGDWVRQKGWKPKQNDFVGGFVKHFAPKPRRHGWVTGTVASTGNVLVNWPGEPHQLDSLPPETLEHDEAPE